MFLSIKRSDIVIYIVSWALTKCPISNSSKVVFRASIDYNRLLVVQSILVAAQIISKAIQLFKKPLWIKYMVHLSGSPQQHEQQNWTWWRRINYNASLPEIHWTCLAESVFYAIFLVCPPFCPSNLCNLPLFDHCKILHEVGGKSNKKSDTVRILKKGWLSVK